MNRFFYIVLFCGISFQVNAQNFSIRGKILDAENKPVTGANIYIEELNKGTIRGQNGEFYIQDIKDGKYTLLVTYLSFEKYQRKISSVAYSNKQLIIVLERKEYDLDSIVVTATRYKKSINDVPGRISVLSKAEIAAGFHCKAPEISRG